MERGSGGVAGTDVASSSVSNNCCPQDQGTSSSEMDNTECSETSSELSNSEITRPEGSKKAFSIFDKKISIKKKLKLFSRMATLRDDGIVVVNIPSNLEAASLDLPPEDHHNVALGGEPLDSSGLLHGPPMQIVMLIVGTRGDVQPFIAIGKRLQDHGHRVRLATHANFKEFVTTAGLDFYPLGGDPKILAGYMVKNKGFLPSTPSEIPVQRKQIREIIFSLLPACKDPDIDTGDSFSADAIIANPAAYGHVHVAEALNVPIHIIFTMPWTPTCEFPHPFSRVKQPAGYRLSYQIVDSFVWLGIRDMVNDLRKRKLKLRPVTYLSGTHAYSIDIPHSYIWSPYLVPKPKDWGPKIDVVGFCFLDLASNYEPPEQLLRWLGSGDKPIYIGFGSLPIPEPDKLTRIIVEALEITGQRGIINKGWGGLGNLETSKESVYVLDNIPHDWLFLQCKAVDKVAARVKLDAENKAGRRLQVEAQHKGAPRICCSRRSRLVPSQTDLKASMGDKADWCDNNLKIFFEIVKGEIDAGNRPMGKWTSTGWKNLVVKYHEKTGLNQTKKQLKNKLDYMKKEYTWFMELKNSDTGLGWNEAKQTVECSNDWWNEHLAKCNNPEKGIKCNHVKFRKQGPKHLDDLHILFEKVHVTGASASCPGNISSDESSDDDVAEVQKTSESDDMKLAELKKAKPGKKKRKDNSTATEEKDEKSPFFRLYKNTCKRIETAADKISTSVSASSAPPANQVPTIKEAMQMVKDCGVQEATPLMHTATFLIVKPEFREAFSTLVTNEGRLDLLEREHQKEELKRN